MLPRKKNLPALELFESRDTPATLGAGFVETHLAVGLDKPTAFAFLPDNRILIAEQSGKLRIVKNRVLLANPALNISSRVDSQSERGLLGIAVDPAFTSNHRIYLHYTTSLGGSHNRVSRFQMSGDTVVATSERVVLDLETLPSLSALVPRSVESACQSRPGCKSARRRSCR